MPLTLAEALRLDLPARVTIVGAGGKTTALYQLARQLPPQVIVTTTTHLGFDQLSLGDAAVSVTDLRQVGPLFDRLAGVTTVYGDLYKNDRVAAPSQAILDEIFRRAEAQTASAPVSILVEGDGARGLPLKAPALHEPVIPAWTRTVIVVAGLSALGKPLGPDWVHRPERFASLAGDARLADLTGLAGEPITIELIGRVLTHPEGGMKGAPAGARLVALLNQADTASLRAAAGRLADLLLPPSTRLSETDCGPGQGGLITPLTDPAYERVLIASLGLPPDPPAALRKKSVVDVVSPPGPVHAVRRRVAGILLAFE